MGLKGSIVDTFTGDIFNLIENLDSGPNNLLLYILICKLFLEGDTIGEN